MARLILSRPTDMPWSACQSRACSSKVASGCASNCAKRPASNAAPFLAGRACNRFGVHVAGLSSLFQVAFDRRGGHCKGLRDLRLGVSLIDCAQDALPP